MDLSNRFPSLHDLRAAARRRIPHFMWEYLDSATGTELGDARNRQALDRVLFRTQVLLGEINPNLKTRFLGREYSLPFGVAPVGMSGAIWPGAERILAGLAASREIPFCLSTMATRAPEEVGPVAGDMGWFQLYPPAEGEILDDMLARIIQGGFETLVITVDVPGQSRRERQTRGGLTHPPTITPRTLSHIMSCPSWALGTMRHGMPKMPFIDKYSSHKGPLPSTAHIGYLLRIPPDWDYLARIRERWKGHLIVKGILEPEDAVRCREEGIDAVWVSNHAARQFEASPGAVDCVAPIRDAMGPNYPLIFDSGVMGGLDVLRPIALGADFVMLGKAFHYGLGAAGAPGAAHVVDVLDADLRANMVQMGITRPTGARDLLVNRRR